MSSTAMRTPAKVQSLRAHEIDGGEKTAGSQTHLARAVTLHLAGKREEALKQLQRAIAANEASAEIYRAMGHIQFELGNFDEAAKSYRILAQVKPQYAMGWFNLAVCLERAGAWEDASQAFHRACTLDAAYLDAHLGLGVCHLRQEDPKSALFSFERCLELNPAHEDALFGKAVALQSLGHPDEASEIYQKILERNPDSEESLSNLILIGMAKEDFDMVREYSEHLLELRPESTVALEGLASWACAAGEHALTAKFCTLLVNAVPGHFEGWFNLALAHQKSGRLEPAAEAYAECVKLRAAILRGAHQPRHRARAARRYCRRARGLRTRHQGGPRSARAALEHRAAAGALRPVRRSRALLQTGAGARARRKRKRVSAWAICACSAKISAAPPKPSKAA